MIRGSLARLRAAALAAVLLVTAALAGCDPFGGGSSSPGGGTAPKADANNAKPGCAQAGPLTKDFLPVFPPDTTRTIENPCLKLVGLASEVTGLIPKNDRKLDGMGEFFGKLDELVGRAAKVGDAVECGYETDRLALSLYQDRDTLWSVGVVAVIRGDIDALAQGAICFLFKQLQIDLGQGAVIDDQPRVEPCADAHRRSKDGQDYTILYLGSSNVMCSELEGQLTPGQQSANGITATVKATPNVILRGGPSTSDPVVDRIPAGTVLIVACWVEGENVSGRRGSSDRWDQALIGTQSGYISDVWLDTGDADPDHLPHCTS